MEVVSIIDIKKVKVDYDIYFFIQKCWSFCFFVDKDISIVQMEEFFEVVCWLVSVNNE